MLNWFYCKFKQIMQAKAKNYDCLIVPCTEHYTSKICSQCDFNDDHWVVTRLSIANNVELLWTET
jgi:transposase